MANPFAYLSTGMTRTKGFINPSWNKQKQARGMARMLVYEPDEDTILAGNLFYYGELFSR
jgi:hypothetical protein